MKSKGGPPALPPWPSGAPASSLSSSSPRPQRMGKHRASHRLCSALPGRSAVDLARATGKRGGCRTLTWQRAGGCATHAPLSCPGPLQTMDLVLCTSSSSTPTPSQQPCTNVVVTISTDYCCVSLHISGPE